MSTLEHISQVMSGDWNRRARSDARYYVALGRKNQSWQDFFKSGEDLARALEQELVRISSTTAPHERTAVEIGCGPGRLMLPLSRHFREIHGVDVSERMIRLARQNLAGVANAHVHTAGGTNLEHFADESFDFAYSYAVFQHIPSRAVVFNYIKETQRILRIGGVARMQLNGLPVSTGEYDTWSGVRFTAAEIATFAQELDLRLLALEGAGTQYMWCTFAKRPPQKRAAAIPRITIRRITTAESSSLAVPARGRYAAIALWVEKLPAEADLNVLRIEVGGLDARITCIAAPQRDGIQQVTALLSAGLEACLQPVRLLWANTPLASESFLRVVPPGPEVPRITSVTDAVCPGNGGIVSSNLVRVSLEESYLPTELRAAVNGRPARRTSFLSSIPDRPRFEVDFVLPARSPAGKNRVEFWLGRRYLGAWDIIVDRDRFWWWRKVRELTF